MEELLAAAKAFVDAYNKFTAKAAPPVTLEHLRGVLAEKSREGYTAKIRALIEKYGATKLSDIDPSKYADLLVEAEAFKNG